MAIVYRSQAISIFLVSNFNLLIAAAMGDIKPQVKRVFSIVHIGGM
jgi:hypothetical protein